MLFLKCIKKYKYIIILLFIVLIFVLCLFINKEKQMPEENIIKNYNIEEVTIEEKNKIKIDIKGAVKNPGVYELDANTRVSDAINISGGLTQEADTSIINLSKTLKDEMVIIIYTKQEIKEMKKGTTTVKYIEKECICPKLENDACIESTINNKDETTNENSSKISLNKATIKELTTLSGIGESKANAIIEYRDKNGGFKTIEELKNVSGIGNSTYEKIKDNITI